jgi:hypothetical protein
MAQKISDGWIVDPGEYCLGGSTWTAAAPGSPQQQVCKSEPRRIPGNWGGASGQTLYAEQRQREAAAEQMALQEAFAARMAAAQGQMGPRGGRFVGSIVGSQPIESYLGPSVPEPQAMAPSGEVSPEPPVFARTSEHTSAARRLVNAAPRREGFTFMSAEVDASRSVSAAEAVSRTFVGGLSAVRGR